MSPRTYNIILVATFVCPALAILTVPVLIAAQPQPTPSPEEG